MAMSTHSVAEAKNQLSRLIDRALAGEPVVITRHGHPVVEIKAVQPGSRHTPKEALAWLEGKRLKLPAGVDAQAILRQLRDGE
jgi:antitoxin (DNA-binding transcriptional repressor) of toxin-antitoxin stability system